MVGLAGLTSGVEAVKSDENTIAAPMIPAPTSNLFPVLIVAMLQCFCESSNSLRAHILFRSPTKKELEVSAFQRMSIR